MREMRHRRHPDGPRRVPTRAAARADAGETTPPTDDESEKRTQTGDEPGERTPTENESEEQTSAGGESGERSSVGSGSSDARTAAGAGPGRGGGQRSTMVDRDDVLRGARDRQVLVVGDTTVGRVLTGLLGWAGYDPVLAAADAESVEPTATVVDRRAFDVLAAAGVAEAVRDRGTSLAAVSSTWPRGNGRDPASSVARVPPDRPRPVAVETTGVRRVVDAECGTARAATDRAVDEIVRAEDGLEVAFENGVREWFDVVVDVVGARLSQGSRSPRGEAASLRQYETRVAVQSEAPTELRDVWTEDGLVQCVPMGDGTATLLRVTTPASDRSSELPDATVTDHLPEDVAGLSAALSGVEPTEVGQRRRCDDDPDPEAWGRGRVMRCGVAASPTAPASGLALSRGIADAGALVSALTRSRGAVEAAVDAYGADRARAAATARPDRTTADPTRSRPTSAVADDALRALATDRRLALTAIRDPEHRTR
jgi:2-polyprenyl-6-methoxyphenol hydroxylase-like FAD-dependent oxidoreductase